MPRKVLVTGAYGFLGRNVARRYAHAGWSVVSIGHGAWPRDESSQWGISEWHSADITLDSLLTYAGEPDVIVHCAGSGSVGFSMSHPYQDFQRTVGSTAAVLEFARQHSPKARVVYPSSAGIYGLAEEFPIRESHRSAPVSPYGTHKKIAEELCCSYSNRFGVPAAIVRLFSVYGPELRKQLLWDACLKIRQGTTTFFGTGEETRDWIHVDDAATLLYEAGERATALCPIVNGASGIGTRIADVLTELFKCFGRTDRPIFAGEVRPGDPQHYMADISRALEWGWRPQVDWHKGIADYVNWFRASNP